MDSFQRSHSPIRRAIVYLSLITFAVGCTSMHVIPISDRANIANYLAVGDKVEVARKDGGTVKFRVEEISDSGIGGEGHAIAYDDIQQLKVAQSTGSGVDKKTTWVVLGMVAVLILTGVIENQEIQGY